MDARTARHTLEVILPSDLDTVLLGACLSRGDKAVASWNEWSARVGDPKRAFERDRRGLKGLLPLAHANARTLPAPLPPDLMTYLRVSTLREELRSQIIRGVFAEAVEALRAVSIVPITLRGFALAELVYAAPAERHCHELDLLVREDELDAARRAISCVGFVPLSADPRERELRHETGLPLRLNLVVGARPCYVPPLPEILARAQDRAIAGAPSRVLSPADQLLDSTIHAATDASRSNLQWICDVWHLIHAPAGVEWDTLIDTVGEGAHALPLSVTLDYLSTRLGARIPDEVCAELRDRAAAVEPLHAEAAVMAAVVGVRSAFRALFGRSIPWRERLSLASALALPSAGYLQLTGQSHSGASLPLFYLQRPVRYVASRSRARVFDWRSRGD